MEDSDIKQINVILSTVEPYHGIGYKGELCYGCSSDRILFQSLTSGRKIPSRLWADVVEPISKPSLNTLSSPKDPPLVKQIMLMGRNTFLSLPVIKKDTHRIIYVITSLSQDHLINKQTDISVYTFKSIEEALKSRPLNSQVWVCGGSRVYDWFFKHKYFHRLYWTQYHGFTSDNIMPMDTFSYPPMYLDTGDFKVKRQLLKESIDNPIQIYLETWIRSNSGEVQILTLMEKVLKEGVVKVSRGNSTHSIFKNNGLEFDLQKGFPLLTSRKIWFKGVVEELLFFLSGKTQTSHLEEKGVNIWVGNTRRSFLDKRGLDYKEGDMGPLYGFQWKHWGASYTDGSECYDGKGIDQVTLVLEQLKKDPFSRRHIISAWNVSDLSKMSLEPCHIMIQFNVRDEKEVRYLDAKVYMRSCDMFHGLPFNVASYALLVHMFSLNLSYTPGRLLFNFGDLHIYDSHEPGVRKLLNRIPRPFPKLNIKTHHPDLKYSYEDFELIDYNPHPGISLPMVV